MREFTVKLRSVKDVQDFVGLATNMGFPIEVEDGHHCVNGCSFMEMFCLDCTRPLTVKARCDDSQFESFRGAAARFLAE